MTVVRDEGIFGGSDLVPPAYEMRDSERSEIIFSTPVENVRNLNEACEKCTFTLNCFVLSIPLLLELLQSSLEVYWHQQRILRR